MNQLYQFFFFLSIVSTILYTCFQKNVVSILGQIAINYPYFLIAFGLLCISVSQSY
ncbi:MAG: hypothetical protein EXX96DRAFT_565072 [Benjaminiella poitrasii]|nr:MAG: hypothetical protein EXX96DRAFT_592201 [Benjaminiella poitrasii]KAI9481020.1 MAG: hypothetical protein EXX96DRAFT_565072 [Benjaminiella poitrasii]